MVKSLHRVTIALAALLTAFSVTAEVRTILEPRLIDEMETVRLTLRIAGSTQAEAPDFSPLEADFELLGTQNSSRISSINGRTSAVVEYQITLRPKRTGELLVPSLKVGDEYSEAIKLAVRPLDPTVRDTIQKMIFFETEFTANPVYVQAQTVLIRRLYYSAGVQIYSDLPGVPELADAVVVPLGDTRSSTTIRDGQRYGVIEQRFALFPENSGELRIPPISVTSSVRLQSGGRTRRSGIRVNTDTMVLEVLPIPPGYPADQAWLPAESVTLDVNWTPDANSYDIGDPISVTLKALAVGNVASSLPPLNLALPEQQFKLYPEAPNLAENASGNQVVGTREETFALIPTSPGRASVPPISLTWWDTVADQLRQTQLPARSLLLTGTVVAEQSRSEAVSADEPADTQAEGASADSDSWALPDPGFNRIFGAGGALAVVLVLFLGWAAYRWLPLPGRLQQNLDAYLTTRALRRRLNASAHADDLAGFRIVLGNYLAHVCHTSPQHALERFRENPDADRLLTELEQQLYARSASRSPEATVDTSALLALARKFHRAPELPRNDLPPLYG